GDGDDADPFQDREKLLVNHLYAFDHAAGRPGFGGLDGPLQVVDDGKKLHHQLLGALGLALLQLAAGPLAIVVKLRLQPEQPVVKLLPLALGGLSGRLFLRQPRLELGDGRRPLGARLRRLLAAGRGVGGSLRLFPFPAGSGAVAASAGRAAWLLVRRRLLLRFVLERHCTQTSRQLPLVHGRRPMPAATVHKRTPHPKAGGRSFAALKHEEPRGLRRTRPPVIDLVRAAPPARPYAGRRGTWLNASLSDSARASTTETARA